MTFLQLISLFIIVYLCVFGLVSRICKCIETKAMAKSYSKFMEITGHVNVDEYEYTKEVE